VRRAIGVAESQPGHRDTAPSSSVGKRPYMQHLSTPLFLFAATVVSAQNDYSFEHDQQPYTELTNAVYCDFNSDADDPLPELNGETFMLYDQAWTGTSSYPITIGGHGFIRIETATELVILDGFFTNVVEVDSTSNVSYAITGDAGEKVLTAQWHNIRFATGPADSYLNYQIRLYQATGVVEVHMGPNSGSDMDYTDASGPNCGIFHSPWSFSGCYDKLWVEQDANDPTLDSLPNYDFDALHNLPAPNSVYRFVPRFSVTAVPEASPFNTELDARYDAGSGQLLVALQPDQSTGQLTVIDAAGRVLHTWPAKPGSMVLSVADLPTGPYSLSYSSASRASVWRFVRR